MKKISLKVPSKKTIALLVLALVFVGIEVYQLQELRGLRARVHSLEAAQAEQTSAEQASAAEKVNYEILGKTEKTVRVEDYSNYEQQGTATTPTYVAQKVTEYHIKVTNNTSWTYDYAEGDIRGKTASGNLIAPVSFYSIHPDDKQGPETVSLVPGGYAEIYVYIPTNQPIVDLYYSSFSDV